MEKIISKSLGFTLACLSLAFANPLEKADLSRYEQKTLFKVQNITTPKVVIYETQQTLDQKIRLYDQSAQAFRHYEVTKKNNAQDLRLPMTVLETSKIYRGAKESLADQDSESRVWFDTQVRAKTIVFERDQSAGAFTGLATKINSVAPEFVTLEIRNTEIEDWQTLVSQAKFRSYLSLPKTTARFIRITYTSPHGLRINEIEFLKEKPQSNIYRLTFFAEEDHSYLLYSVPHWGTEKLPLEIRPAWRPLNTDEHTPIFNLPGSHQNPDFNPDFDGDGLNDDIDLCPQTADTDNRDLDQNGKGDVCEDPDQDRLMSNQDNCQFVYNPRQSDKDDDGVGDKCDEVVNQITESASWLLGLVFGLMAGILCWLLWRSSR